MTHPKLKIVKNEKRVHPITGDAWNYRDDTVFGDLSCATTEVEGKWSWGMRIKFEGHRALNYGQASFGTEEDALDDWCNFVDGMTEGARLHSVLPR